MCQKNVDGQNTGNAALYSQAMHSCDNKHNKYGHAAGGNVSTVAVLQIDPPISHVFLNLTMSCLRRTAWDRGRGYLSNLWMQKVSTISSGGRGSRGACSA